MSATRRRLVDGRWHFQHGPIDCLVSARGTDDARARCVEHAWTRFGTILDELVAELPLLKTPLPVAGEGRAASVVPRGPVARRMAAACAPHAADGRFVTPMAAVAGSVAEALVASFDDPGIDAASINNGGDIALHLAAGARVEVGLAVDLARALGGAAPEGRFAVDAASPVRGIATSGWRGRSFSLGIADAVTVLARSASRADAAATIVGNAVDVEAEGIVRRPAASIRDDSDLGERLVTVDVPALAPTQVEAALASGAAEAERQIAAGRIVAAVLCLQGRVRVCGSIAGLRNPARQELAAC